MVQAVYSKYYLFYNGKFYFTKMYSSLEGVLYVDDPGCAFADEYADHVEAQRIEVRALPGEILFGKRADGGLLVGGDGFEWIPEAQSAAHLDLDEDEGILVAQDQIQLPVTGAVVALDELVSLLQQVAQRELFAPRAGEAFAQGPTPA